MATTPPIWSGAAQCDFCTGRVQQGLPLLEEGKRVIRREEAAVLYDAATKQGPWATMCEPHFQQYSRGMLGTGFGQKYVCDANRNFVKVEG